nr:MAG TPA: Ogr/Delta-like zinc finger protein [Caudoviricetes sp.]
MKCPLCNIEMSIQRSYTEVTGDNSPDTETQVFTVQELTCRNKQCSNYGKIVETAKTQLHLS